MLRLFCTMPKKFRACLRWLKHAEMTAGKITLFAVLTGAILSGTTLAAYFEIFIPLARASTVSTTVTVLNTPPQWDTIGSTGYAGFAHEDIESSTSTPTNAGAVIYFDGSATDSSGDSYFMIVCYSTSTAPTPHINAPPTCNGGNQYQVALSATTTSGAHTQAATTTSYSNHYWDTEKYDWTAWVCDFVTNNPACNSQMT